MTTRPIPAHAQLLFKGADAPEPLPALSEKFQVQTPGGRTLHLRQWHSPGTPGPNAIPPSDANNKEPIILMVHGLGGTTDWLSPFATKILEHQPMVFGLDIPRIGTNPTQQGDFADRADLMKEIADSIDWLSEKYQRPVYTVGLSLGGLLVTHMAAQPPKNLAGIVVISPAYKGAPETFKPGLYIKSLIRRVFEKARILKSGKVLVPFADDQRDITRNPNKIRLMQETPDRVRWLSTRACVELIKLTLLDTPKVVKNIHVPLMLFVSQHDRICDPRAMFKAFDQFPSQDKKLCVFPEAMHDLTLDPEMPVMATTMCDWIANRQAQETPTPPSANAPKTIEKAEAETQANR